jgi:ABC-type lipoprotein export system ATPase subunit
MTRVLLRDVHRSFAAGGGQLAALAGVTLTVPAGQFVSVVGPSGAGKSTLLHLVGGLDRPTAGQVEVGGTELGDLDDEALAAYRRRRVGFVFQSANLMARLTAVENAAVPCLLDGLRPAAAAERALAALARVGVADLAGRRTGELSGGQAQRVAVARALVADPPLVLADEPTGNLDSRAGEQVLELLRALPAQGRTVLMVTHNEAAAAAGDRVVSLADGRVTGDVPTRAPVERR